MNLNESEKYSSMMFLMLYSYSSKRIRPLNGDKGLVNTNRNTSKLGSTDKVNIMTLKISTIFYEHKDRLSDLVFFKSHLLKQLTLNIPAYLPPYSYRGWTNLSTNCIWTMSALTKKMLSKHSFY